MLNCIFYQQSLLTDWKLANIALISKKGWNDDPGNYGPVGLSSILGKVMEEIILSAMAQHRQDN